MSVRCRWFGLLSVAGEDQCGNDRVVVAHFYRYDMRVNRVPGLFGLGEDVVNLLAGRLDAECEIIGCAVSPLAHEQAHHRVIGRGIEVTGQDDGERGTGKTVQNELSLGGPADTVEGLKMCAGHHDGVAVGKDKGSLEQAPLLHAADGMRQLDIVDIYKLMPREQADAVMASAEVDGGPKESLHAAIVGQLGDEIAVVLLRAIGSPGIVIHFLQSDKVGLILLDELPQLLQAGIMAGMEVKGHDFDSVVVTLSRSRKGQQTCRYQKNVKESHCE